MLVSSKNLSKAFSVITIVIALLGLLGYFPGIELLGRIKENFIPMAPSTSIALVLLSGNLMLMSSRYINKVTRNIILAITILITIYAIHIALDSILYINTNIEKWLIPDMGSVNNIPIGHMSPVTALLITLTGFIQIVILNSKESSKQKKLTDYIIGSLQISLFATSFVFILAYFFGTPLMYDIKDTIPMALTTAFAFFFHYISLFAFRATQFPTRLFTESSTRAYLNRFIIPIAFFSVLIGGIPSLNSLMFLAINPAIITSLLTIMAIGFTVVVVSVISQHIGNDIDNKNNLIVLGQQALLESEKKYRSIFENSAIAILLTAPDGRIFSANIAACKMFERTEEEICNIGRDGLVDKTDPRLKILLEERRKNGRARGEIYMLRKDGTKFNVEVSSVIFLDIEGGEKTSMVIQDLTERKKIEKELNESKQLFQNLAEFSPFGIFQNNHEGQTTYVNPKWVELSGLSYSEAMGTGWLSAIHPDDKEKLVSDWQKGLQNHVETLSEYRFLKPDGTEVWVLGKAVPYFSNNTFAGFIGTIVDITDRKKFEEELISLKENLQDQVNEQTKVLKSKIKELENFREATINREFRMAELKDEIKRLKDEKNGIDD